ncbi:MAG: polysaccharide export protein [Muribaculaceae bacterium]|nr:polysaccharide export protein [Bacteroides sp.]MDE6680271.1 polysaccharide export protein [Muribaculaceae bacterium]MDE6842791.1 polysaccharide export protein [Muribaculaceae bacterium]MDE7189340.1 polysaccharide export protein [Muribaculaceae bacterium]
MVLALGSCTPKNIAYFQDLDTVAVTEVAARRAIRIEPEDKLSIVIKSKDPALAELFNLNVVSNRLGQTNSQSGTGSVLRNTAAQAEGLAAYTVTKDGNIDFPVLGTLHIQGMTREELAGFIKGELMGRNLIKDPVVTVEFLNTGVSVLGEVRNPGRYDTNSDYLTVIDALTLAGDINIQGRRDNVLVMREENGVMNSYRLDMTNAQQLLNSPGYYLKQDDIIYVEPNDYRKRQTTNNGNTTMSASFWVSVASLLTSVASTIVTILLVR